MSMFEAAKIRYECAMILMYSAPAATIPASFESRGRTPLGVMSTAASSMNAMTNAAQRDAAKTRFIGSVSLLPQYWDAMADRPLAAPEISICSRNCI